MKLKTILTSSVLMLSLASAQAYAGIYTFNDNPSDPDVLLGFPTWTGTQGDEIGTPKVESLVVTTNDDNILQTVVINLEGRRDFDSLFINTGWDRTVADWEDWDFFVRDDDPSGMNDPQGLQGLYSVTDPADYTYVDDFTTGGRDGHGNGFMAASLSSIDALFAPTLVGNILTYDFTGLTTGIDFTGGFTIAYGPWCMNDVAGGSAPVPEPATMLLFGTGLAGLAGFSRRKGKKA